MVDLAPCPACGAACSQQDFEGPNFKGKIWLCSKNHMMRGGECRGDMYLSEEAWQEHALPPSDEDWVEVVARAFCDAEANYPIGYFADGSPMRAGGVWEEYMPQQHAEWRRQAQAALTALTPLLAKVREEALEECRLIADDHAKRAWEIGAAEQQNFVCSSGRNHGARAIESAIRFIQALSPDGERME